MSVRRSPMLQCLPRREPGAAQGGMVVKLRTTIHRRRRDPVPRPHHVLTVPMDIAEQLPKDCRFRVLFEGDRIIYERLDVAR